MVPNAIRLFYIGGNDMKQKEIKVLMVAPGVGGAFFVGANVDYWHIFSVYVILWKNLSPYPACAA